MLAVELAIGIFSEGKEQDCPAQLLPKEYQPLALLQAPYLIAAPPFLTSMA